MTPGLERAQLELQRLQAVDPDSFAVVGEPRVVDQRLIARISLRLGPMEAAEGGLDLREREEFLLRVPADFPFAYPSLWVEHDRFAGFPHVIWGHGICLYRSLADWNPSDGLFGFFDKLRAWLGKGAINDMDPLDAPVEPPHHVTAFSQRPFVIRANAPSPPGCRWLGFARLEKHPNRIELTGWVELSEDWPDAGDVALAVFLAGALPMEFPEDGRGFFAELAKQGIERKALLSLLAFAATLTSDGEPIHLVVGLPMRRDQGGAARQHIAVWTTPAALTENLRLTVAEEGDSSKLKDLRQDLGDTLYRLLEGEQIAWCRILEDRPEIIRRRDHDTPMAWFSQKRVLVLGCGGLGSWIAEFVARAGASLVHLVDHEIVKPGLLGRQNFRLDDIAASKAEALAARLGSIAPSVATRHSKSDAHAFIMADLDGFCGFDAVIDCTASAIMQMKLERDWASFDRDTPPILSIGIDADASRCLAVILPARSGGGIWDAYIHLKRRLCVPGENRRIIDAFYSEDASRHLFQPEPGCSDPTFRGSAADVCGIASTALNIAAAHLGRSDDRIGITFEAHQPAQARAECQILPIANFDEVVSGRYRIRVSPNVYVESRGWVAQNNRRRSKQHETGGLLWGLWDDAVQVIWVFDASGPPRDSRHDPGHFVCGVRGTAEEHSRRTAQSHGTCGFIGLWHTHPEMHSDQSLVDIGGMTALVSAMGQNQRRALMIIFGRAGDHPTAGFFVYESMIRDSSRDLISVGVGQVRLENVVV